MTGTDLPLTIATFVGAGAVFLAAGVAAVVSYNINKWQGGAQYREGLNEQRRRAYPSLIRWTDQMSVSVRTMTQGSSPDPITPDHYAQLWCCASPDLLHAVTKLSKAWADVNQPLTKDQATKVNDWIEKVRQQARWDLFGTEGFEWGAGQKIDLETKSRRIITYGVQDDDLGQEPI